MPKGGYRPGAGRPKGAVKLPAPQGSTGPDAARLDPLAYLLAVMNDEGQPVEVRLRAAGMALPYTAARPAPAKRKPAPEAAGGNGWDHLLMSKPDLYAPWKVKGFGGG